MKSFYVMFVSLLALLLMTGASQAEAQVTDTILITIEGNVAGVILTGEYVTPLRVGDTVIFKANVVDEEGLPINALISFFTEDSTILRLETITDPTLGVNEGMARGIALKKATVRVWAIAEPITEMRLATFRDGVLNWSGEDSILVGESIQYCAWLTRGNRLVAESPGPPTCPSVFVADPLPAPYHALSRLDRSMDRAGFDRLARGLPVNATRRQ